MRQQGGIGRKPFASEVGHALGGPRLSAGVVFGRGVVALASLSSLACASDDVDWCARTREFSVRASGDLSIAYDGLYGTSATRYDTFVRKADDHGPIIQGCGTSSDDQLWLFYFAWGGLPPSSNLPVSIQLASTDLPYFVGSLSACPEAECAEQGENHIFVTKPGINAKAGSGTITEYDPNIGKLVAHTQVMDRQNTLTVIDVDLRWPPKFE